MHSVFNWLGAGSDEAGVIGSWVRNEVVAIHDGNKLRAQVVQSLGLAPTESELMEVRPRTLLSHFCSIFSVFPFQVCRIEFDAGCFLTYLSVGYSRVLTCARVNPDMRDAATKL